MSIPYIKIILALGALSGVAYFVMDYIDTKQEAAVTTATLESTVVAFGNYATDVESEVAGQAVALGALMQGYQEAGDEKARLENILAKHDLGELAKSRPGLVANRINDGTARMFSAIEKASRGSKGTGPPATPKAGADPY